MNRLEKLALWHQVSSSQYLGPVRFRQLWRTYRDDIGCIFRMKDKELAALKGVGTTQSIKGIRAQAGKYQESLEFMRTQLEKAEKSGGEIITLDDPNYPEFLLNSKMSHAIIYCIGRVKDLQSYDLAAAVVGTRGAAAESRKTARDASRDLAKSGWVVVSGMAKGIDSEAHEGALAGGGKTIAVLGCGPDVIYPKEATDLYIRIKAQGLILSEYPFGERVDTLKLKKRNKTTVALALGVFLVESDADGGAMNAIKACREQNKPAATILPHWSAKISGNRKAADAGAVVIPTGLELVPALMRALKSEPAWLPEDKLPEMHQPKPRKYQLKLPKIHQPKPPKNQAKRSDA